MTDIPSPLYSSALRGTPDRFWDNRDFVEWCMRSEYDRDRVAETWIARLGHGLWANERDKRSSGHLIEHLKEMDQR